MERPVGPWARQRFGERAAHVRAAVMDALHRAWQASKLVSSWAVVVDAKKGSRDFYLQYEFTPFAIKPDRLFLLMKKIDFIFLIDVLSIIYII